MILKDVVELAKYSELNGVAAKDDINAVIAFINLGMLELYKRFPIKVEEYVVTRVEDQMFYSMPSNCLYVTEAFREIPEGSQEDNEVAINGEFGELSVFFSDWSTVQIPFDFPGDHVSIMYVKRPDIVSIAQAADSTYELQLPDALVDALLSYVGYKGHLGVKSDAQSENNAQWLRFERSCKKATELGLAHPADSVSMPNRIDDRGFV